MYIFQNKLDGLRFLHYMTYGDYKDLQQLQTNYYIIKCLLLQIIGNMMAMKVDLLQWFTNVLTKIQNNVVLLKLMQL